MRRRGYSIGPAKGYIEGLEHRLHEAESLLLALLPLISPDQLNCAADSLLVESTTNSNTKGLNSRDSHSPTPRAMRNSPPVLNKKTGIEYWESFPLDTVENIRKWQQDCAMHSSQLPPLSNQSLLDNSSDDLQSHPRSHSHHSSTAQHAQGNAPGSRSRPRSVDISLQNHPASTSASTAAPFRSVSSESSYRSETGTPVNVSQQHPHSHSSIPATIANPSSSSSRRQNQIQSQSQSQPRPHWQSLSLFPPSNNNNNPSGANIGAEALLLQSFADSTSWAPQSQSQSQNMSGMNMSMSTSVDPGMSADNGSGPMEIDTGFFATDLQRRLFW
ncbi:hypothetical protein A1O3_00134 [Capronia epimyces CBS 606.96]|uniref:Uncharacterized protein n=1 Tax=Capronia epimyces CBS 606.96 TaxID=1182542 RepID=W9YQP4_9EURO|nr:uncharacterized protein A1O3_00134 [Capronia epimyces CBS 606.96]EXJ91586.1 hypothetical protein A1O3_00134 [Capronia epimyces CBS 606.96]